MMNRYKLLTVLTLILNIFESNQVATLENELRIPKTSFERNNTPIFSSCQYP